MPHFRSVQWVRSSARARYQEPKSSVVTYSVFPSTNKRSVLTSFSLVACCLTLGFGLQPEIVSTGHLEVYDDWVLMNLTANGILRPETDPTYQQMALEVMTGTHQLLYNHIRDDDVIA